MNERAILKARTFEHVAVIPFYLKVLYALPFLMENFIRFFNHTWIKLEYVKKMKGLNAFSYVSAFETGSLFIFMPLIGLLIDRIRGGKFGRRLPVLAVLIPVFMGVCIPLAVNPDKSYDDFELSAWFKSWGFAHNVLGMAWHVTYLALGLGLTDDFNERTTLFLIAGIGTTIGGLAGTAIPGHLPDSSYMFLMIGLSLAFGFFAALAAWFLRERVSGTATVTRGTNNADPMSVQYGEPTGEEDPLNPDANQRIIPVLPPAESTNPVMTLVPAFIHCFRNGPFVILFLLQVMGSALIKPTDALVLTYTFGVPKSMLSNLTIVNMCATIAGGPVWIFVSRWLGKRLTMQIGMAGMGLMLILVWCVPAHEKGDWEVWLFVALPAFFAPAITDLSSAMLADVVDYDQFLWGKKERNEGIFTIVLHGIPIGSAVQTCIVAFLVAVNLDTHEKTQTESTTRWLRAAVSIGFVTHLIGAILLFFYRITPRIHAAILEGIAERLTHNEKQAVASLYGPTPINTVEPTQILNPVTGRYLPVTESEESRHIPLLDHFMIYELRVWQLGAHLIKGTGLWLLRLLLIVQFILLCGIGAVSAWASIRWHKSAYFALLVLADCIILAFICLQILRMIASILVARYTTSQLRAHIGQVQTICG